jgi:hypothetical protein
MRQSEDNAKIPNYAKNKTIIIYFDLDEVFCYFRLFLSNCRNFA